MFSCYGRRSSMYHGRCRNNLDQDVRWDDTRTEGSEVCTSTEEKSYLCWSFGDIRSCGINKGWSPQDDQRLDGGTEGHSLEQFLLLER